MAIKQPLQRSPRGEIHDPSLMDFLNLALQRMRYVINPAEIEPQPIMFPLAERMRWEFFAQDDWDEFGNLESEYGRLTYTLTRYPERGPPAACERILQKLLEEDSVLDGWWNVAPELETHATTALHDVCQQQQNGHTKRECTTKSDYATLPVDYTTGERSSELTLRLWHRSLEEIASQLAEGHSAYFEQFLQIHAFLKDPIYGFRKAVKDQAKLFERLLRDLEEIIPRDSLDTEAFKRLAAQGAQESAFLTSPLLARVSLIHFAAHHQLTYASVPLDSLARAEFSVPSHVLEVVEEMMLAVASNEGLACPIVPILVTTRPVFSKKEEYLTPIIDGNHRATAALLLRFLAGQPLLADGVTMGQRLLGYCIDHRLGKKWQIDLSDVLKELYTEQYGRLRYQLTSQNPLLRKFATVQCIPALIVQEEDFHTICKQRSVGKSKPVLLHPFHQTLFNDDELPFALPQKAGQTHGRPEVFRLLPLTPFGTSHDVNGREVFKATVRESMNGLADESAAMRGRRVRKFGISRSGHMDRAAMASVAAASCCLAVLLLKKYGPRLLGQTD
ncbi:hypothetical protein O1611_g7926 [Lasiodiplodia mahajangana]|uniref:Uncharacterized protein n=1 Tax=Lasiodiplodia mahajangana TaxID=1108764 RepID=A0ACC2JEI1_9PEZI|nr:hypothetical protein O1611_g7926 [Lasiodiplodia mahajangana]